MHRSNILIDADLSRHDKAYLCVRNLPIYEMSFEYIHIASGHLLIDKQKAGSE